MQNIRKRITTTVLIILLLLMAAFPCAAFAQTSKVPMYLTIVAAPLEFTVTERIQMEGVQGNDTLTINPLVVNNIGSSDTLKVSSIAVSDIGSGWTLSADSTDFTAAENAKAYSISCDGNDLSAGTYAPGTTIDPQGNVEFALTGKVGTQSELLTDGSIANLVVTVEKAAALISFTIEGTSYQAEEGMTWAEWVESIYNTAEYKAYEVPNCIYFTNPYDNAVGIRTESGSVITVKKEDVVVSGRSYAHFGSGSGGR